MVVDTAAPRVVDVSVVVATYRRAERVERLVRALDQQLERSYEVVVVDDASPDHTWDVLTRLQADRPRLRCVRLERNGGPAVARNSGVAVARGRVVAFTDDDCVPAPGWLSALLAAMSSADVVQGRVEPDPDQLAVAGPFSRTVRVDGARYFETCNVAYRRELLDRLGGFDERLRAGEDTELAYRAREADARFAYAPDALVLHDVSPSDLIDHLRTLPRWKDISLVVALHPQARELMHSRVWWKAAHPRALLAGLGVVAITSGVVRRRALVVTVGVAALAPYAHFRTRRARLAPRATDSLRALPGALLADLAETAIVSFGAVRHRTLFL